MPIWPVLTKIMSITRTPSGMVCTEGGSLGFDGVPDNAVKYGVAKSDMLIISLAALDSSPEGRANASARAAATYG